MSGRWAGSTRAARLPPDWPARVAATAARDHGRCTATTGPGYAPAAPPGPAAAGAHPRCPAPGTECDHVTPGDDHSLANLQMLCAEHHKAKTQLEATAAIRARAAAARLPVERHPGLL